MQSRGTHSIKAKSIAVVKRCLLQVVVLARSFDSFAEAEYVTRACHVDDNTTLMLGRRRKNSFGGQRA